MRRVPPRRRGRAVVDAGVMRLPGLIPVVVASITSIGLHDAEEGSAPDAAAGSRSGLCGLATAFRAGGRADPAAEPH
jgi:hypothetical protein